MDKKHIVIATDNVFFKNHFRDFFDQDNYEVSYFDLNASNELINLKGNLASPMCIDGRVFFLSDHDGIGNIYSCTETGKGLKQHTNHKNYYARNASTDGVSIVYHSGADIYKYDIVSSKSEIIDIDFRSPMIQKSRKYASVQGYLEDYALDKENNMISFTSRGKAFTMGNWDGPVFQLGESHGVRYRLPGCF